MQVNTEAPANEAKAEVREMSLAPVVGGFGGRNIENFIWTKTNRGFLLWGF